VSDEQYASKRERQKARRQERLQREAAAASASKRRQRGVYGLVALVVIALIGGLVFNQIRQRQEREARQLAVEGRLEELGCTPIEAMPNLGNQHLTMQTAALAGVPPEAIYVGGEFEGEPPSSGNHSPSVVPSGVYDVVVDPRLTTHNLEHGYVVAWYSPDADQADIDALLEWGRERQGGDFPKLVVAEYYEPFAEDRDVAFSAWLQRQTCEDFDTDTADVFLDLHYNTPEAPEVTVPSHAVGQQGVIDPAGADLVLPPLDLDFGFNPVLEEFGLTPTEEGGAAEGGSEEPDEATSEVDADAGASEEAGGTEAATES
jgi:hypothetical protein